MHAIHEQPSALNEEEIMMTANGKETEIKLPFQAVVFDSDGVLASTTEQHFTSWSWMFANEIGIGEITREEYHEHIDGKLREAGLLALMHARGREMSMEDAMVFGEKKRKHYQYLIPQSRIETFAGTIEFARRLKAMGVKLGVASSSEDTPLISESIGIRDLFDVIVARKNVITGDKVETVEMESKPAPDIFLKACEVMGVAPENAAGVEDAVSGIQAIKAAGMMSIAINRVGNKDLEKEGAHVMVSDLS